MDEETTTDLTITVREEAIYQLNSSLVFSENWLREIINYPDLDVELNEFRFKRDQKTMIMRMKKKERRKYLKTLRSFLKS